MLDFTSRPELLGTQGMAASTHWLASSAAMSVLERGGNAFDAAVAGGLVLHVVEPHLNGLGGDMPAIAHDQRTGTTFVVNGQGVAPQAACTEAFLSMGKIPGSGLLPAVVPGAFGAWLLLLREHGTMRLAEVAEYAIDYAENGFPLVEQAVRTITAVSGVFREHWPSSAAIYLPDGEPPAPRGRFRNPDLARTLRRLVAEGEAAGNDREAQLEAARSAFYEGFVAEAIDDFCRTPVWDGTDEAHAGLLTGADLAGWRAGTEPPVTGEFAGMTVAKTGPWGQGPVLLQQLAILEGMDLQDAAPGSPELIHAVVEAAKLAFADREAFYGDPAFVDVPMESLLDHRYAALRRALIGETASRELHPGAPGGHQPVLPAQVIAAMAAAGNGRSQADSAPPAGHSALAALGEPTVPRGDTCHIDVVDRWGNAVAATPSGGWLQSSPVVPGLGFALPTRAQMFWLEPDLPNSVAPGKRPRTTLSPGMLLREGKPYLAFGTPGGDQQDQWVVPFLINHLVHGMDLQAAIDAPTWHTTHFPSSFYPRQAEPAGVHVESRIGEGTVVELRRRGHDVHVTGPW
ncbi:gamma-glutamyltransferase family protein, partial [Georgenia sp. 10Sc9-8]|nr:gamma-glutamyltransferase family protein [Georgenia halotolerans]